MQVVQPRSFSWEQAPELSSRTCASEPVRAHFPRISWNSRGIFPSPCRGSSTLRIYGQIYQNSHHSWESECWEHNYKVISCFSEQKEQRGKSQNTLGFGWHTLPRCYFIRCSQSQELLNKSWRQAQSQSDRNTVVSHCGQHLFASKTLMKTSTLYSYTIAYQTHHLCNFPQLLQTLMRVNTFKREIPVCLINCNV